MHWLNSYEGVLDLNDDLRPGKPEMRVTLKSGAMTLDVDAATIANQLRSAFHGQKAGDIQVGSESYEVDVRLAPLDQNSLSDLEGFHITTKSGKEIPMGSVATLEEGRGYGRILRINSVRTVTIQGDVDTLITNAAEIIKETETLFLPETPEALSGHKISRWRGRLKKAERPGAPWARPCWWVYSRSLFS